MVGPNRENGSESNNKDQAKRLIGFCYFHLLFSAGGTGPILLTAWYGYHLSVLRG